MIERLYIHNFRCLENFEFKPGAASSALLIGKNGSAAAQGQVDEDRHGQSASSWNEAKHQAVQAASRQVPPDADARRALGFMPLRLKGAAIRWRGL